MLGIILLYFIGKTFYDLIGKYKNDKTTQGVYAIIAVISYYAGTFLGGVILGLGEVYGLWQISHLNDLVVGFIALPFGILTVVIFYQILKRNLAKKKETQDSDLIDEEFTIW